MQPRTINYYKSEFYSNGPIFGLASKTQTMKKYLPFFLLLILISCETDDNDIPLTNRYFKLAEVVQLPALAYDPDGSPPDIRIDIKRRSASFWEFSTLTEDNAASLPTFVVFPAEILATDEVYEIRLVDEDLDQPVDEEIFFWTFHAFNDGAGGGIDFYDADRLIMTLNYNDK